MRYSKNYIDYINYMAIYECLPYGFILWLVLVWPALVDAYLVLKKKKKKRKRERSLWAEKLKQRVNVLWVRIHSLISDNPVRDPPDCDAESRRTGLDR